MSDKLINDQIKDKFVQLVLEDGKMIGTLSNEEAKTIADEKQLDIMRISDGKNGSPCICKLVDYGKIKYQESKQKKKNPHKETVKEIKFKLKISDHDLLIKQKHAKELILKNNKVKFMLELSGREKGMKDFAVEKFEKSLCFFDDLDIVKEIQKSDNSFFVFLKKDS